MSTNGVPIRQQRARPATPAEHESAALAGPTLTGAYQGVVLCYLVSLLYLYPYGVPLSAEASLRVPDALALFAVALGCAALLLRQQVRIDRVFLAIVGPFLLLELVTPVIGAVGYRRPVDVVSALRMAMLWLPMVFLTMLAPSWRALRLERDFARVLAVSLWLNFIYATVQLGATLGWLPQWLLVTAPLEPWAVDENFHLVEGLRPAGFFNNSTALSVFGIVCLCFYYARYVSRGVRRDLAYSLLALGIIVLTTSRTAYAASAAIILAGWWHLPTKGKVVLTTLLVCGVSAVLLIVEKTIGVEAAFYRFQRLAESGVLEDVSFGKRVYGTWPTALEAARDYTFGTLIQAPRALPVIDSGYLTYYLQGKWLFVAALATLLAGHWLIGLQAFIGRRGLRLGVMTLFLAIYLTGALVITNPLRSPLMIFFIVYSLWRLRVERQSRPMHAVPDSRAQSDPTAATATARL